MIASRLRLPGIGSHHSANPQTDEWLTPPELLARLGPFDLDPCAALNAPWRTAAVEYTVDDDGLAQTWEGLVWLNPPYSTVGEWMARLADHGQGVALVFARTETSWWFDWVWPHASGLLFLKGRLTFHRPGGQPSKAGHNSGGPSVLIAYGAAAAAKVAGAHQAGLAGAYIRRWRSGLGITADHQVVP